MDANPGTGDVPTYPIDAGQKNIYRDIDSGNPQ